MTRYYHSLFPYRFASVSHLFKIIFLTFFALTIIFLTSCEEDPTTIGEGLLPGKDFVSIMSTDTLSVRSYTMYDDSVQSDNPALSFLGQVYDPYFGTTEADFVSQVRLSGKWDGAPFTIDSVNLFLQLLEVKGGSSDVPHYLRLSEIAEQIYTDSSYYSNKKVPLAGYEVSGIELPVLTSTSINNITIKLPVEFGNYILRDTSKLFYSNTKPDFRTFFKGLLFQLYSASDPTFVAVSLQPIALGSSPSNLIVIYMHDDANVSKEYGLLLNSVNKNASFNRYFHNFSTADPGKKIEHINDGVMDTMSYLQNLNGVYTKVVFPGLEKLKNDPAYKNIAVNKARITVPIYFDGDLYKASTAPPTLRLRYKTKNGYKFDVPDYNIDANHAFFDGKIDSLHNVYNFNIPAYVQGYLKDATGTLKPELEIFQGTGTRNAILKANNSKTPVKFEFTYTKF